MKKWALVQLCGIPTIYAHLTPPFLAASGSEYPLVPPYQDEGEYGEEWNWGNSVPVILSVAKDPYKRFFFHHGGQVCQLADQNVLVKTVIEWVSYSTNDKIEIDVE